MLNYNYFKGLKYKNNKEGKMKMGNRFMEKAQKLGGAMFTPVLLFSFAGIMVGLSTVFKNQQIMGSLAESSSLWYQIWSIIESGAWTVFNNMPLLFAVSLPIGLAKKQNARCCMEALVCYLTFNYFLGQILTAWGSAFGVVFEAGRTGITQIAGITTLDMGIFGAIIVSAVVVYIHNKYFDKELPEFLGIFKGSTFVYMIGFFVMILLAFISAFIWPKVQLGIASLQSFLVSSGPLGVAVYAFLNRILIPTGLHHFVYTPFLYDNVVVNGGIVSYWATHLGEFAESSKPLVELFPQGGFSLFGMEKIFGSIGIAFAFYFTAKKTKKKAVMGLLIPATLTAVFCGITEPLEFTFLFIAPVLFAVHSVLCAFIDVTTYLFGIVGKMDGGLIEYLAYNWIPLWNSHGFQYIIQIIIGFVFSGIYFVVFSFLIKKFNFKTPGREDDDEVKLFTKADYKDKKNTPSKNGNAEKAAIFLEALGGKENIDSVTNCATRLRVTVKDASLVQDAAVFKTGGAHGAVINGTAIQVIVGLSVSMVRDEFEKLL